MSYFQPEMDYIFFFYGLSFLVLAAVCFFLRKDEREMPAWSWLGLFGLAHGGNEWLDMLAFTFSDSSAFSAIRTAVMVVSFLCLFEFGRVSLGKTRGKTPGGWIYAPLLLLASLGGCYGFTGLNASARYALGLTAGLLSCLAVYRGASGKPAHLRRPLLAISAGLGLYALATGGVVPESALAPTHWINYTAFTRFFGFPVQLLRGLLAMFIAISAWTYILNLNTEESSTLKSRRKARVGWASIIALILVVAAGWPLIGVVGESAKKVVMRDSENIQTILYNRLADSLLREEEAVTALAGSPLLPQALTNGSRADIAKANTALDRYCASFNLSVCYLLNMKGVTIASSNRNSPSSFLGKNYGFRPYFMEAAAGRPGHYFALGVTTGERGFYVSRPVKTAGGGIAGAVVVKKNLDFLAKELGLIPYAFLVSPEGVIFLSSRHEMLFRSLWPMPERAAAALAESNQFGPLDPKSILRAEVRDKDVLVFAGGNVYTKRSPMRQEGWSLISFASLHPVHVARFAGILFVFSVCVLLLAFFMVLVQSETAREAAEKLLELKEEVRTLSGIVPICAGCKKIRDDKGYWTQVESYISKHTQALFSHGLCPSCTKRLYPEYAGDAVPAEPKHSGIKHKK